MMKIIFDGIQKKFSKVEMRGDVESNETYFFSTHAPHEYMMAKL